MELKSNIDDEKFTERYIRKLIRLEKTQMKIEAKKRTCLRCEKSFMSLSPENRICYTCKERTRDVIILNNTI